MTTFVTLENFDQTLRGYQLDVVEDALDFVAQEAAREFGSDYGRRLYSSPTGTGKGTMQLALLKELRANGFDAWILTPSLEVLRGCLQRCGVPQEDIDRANPDQLAAMGAQIYVATPTRSLNKLLRGDWGMPDVVIYDEAHHAVESNEVSGTLFALAPDSVWLGFTATPYRGTPKETKALREAWGEPVVVLTIPEAVSEGYQALPSFEVVPLVDDDTVKVVNGKFQTKAAGRKVQDRMDALVDLAEERLSVGPRVPTVVTVPNTETAGRLVEELDARGIGARMVIGTTPARQRALAYEECRTGQSVLVAVAVLTEGVDLPWLGRLIDARPTLSPVVWVQQVGRIMRPKKDGSRPEYVCVCRNLERHAYLMGGAVPREAVKSAQEAFDKPSKRDGHRSVGFEALAKFKRITFPIAGGLRGHMFNVHNVDQNGIKTEWCILASPLSDEAVVARRATKIERNDEGEITGYVNGKWERVSMPDDLAGFATSQQKGALSKRQAEWWTRAAERVGLDPDAVDDLKRRQFQALPVLSDLKLNILNVQ